MARRLAARVRKPRYVARPRPRVRKREAGSTSPPAAPLIARATSRRSRNLDVLSGIAFVAVLALALGFAWRDGAAGAAGPNADELDATYASSAYITGGYAREPFRIAAQSDLPPAQVPVPTARPVQLLIPALDVHRAVEGVGVSGGGVLNLPVNAWNAGWYTGGPVPGAPGDAVIEGHAGYPGKPMIFGRLAMLKAGDRIIVVLADRTRQLFLVDSITTVPVGSAPPGMAEPYGPPRLTLITCTGHFDQNSYSYSRRLVLNASYAGLS